MAGILMAFLSCGFALFAIFLGCGQRDRQQLYRIRSRNIWSAKFHAVATQLIDDDAVPAPFVNNILFINDISSKNGTAKALFIALAKINAEKFDMKSSDITGVIAGLHEYDRDRIILKYVEAIHLGFLMLSYSDWFWGIRVRGFIAELFAFDYASRMFVPDIVEEAKHSLEHVRSARGVEEHV